MKIECRPRGERRKSKYRNQLGERLRLVARALCLPNLLRLFRDE